jgi:hypothetical protein
MFKKGCPILGQPFLFVNFRKRKKMTSIGKHVTVQKGDTFLLSD